MGGVQEGTPKAINHQVLGIKGVEIGLPRGLGRRHACMV